MKLYTKEKLKNETSLSCTIGIVVRSYNSRTIIIIEKHFSYFVLLTLNIV